MEARSGTIKNLIMLLAGFFIVMAVAGLFLGAKYIDNKLLTANENMAADMALLIKNNFHITDAEVSYMKSLSFNQMEVDSLNRRLMDISNGSRFSTKITNIYVLAPLKSDEIKYTVSGEIAEFFGYKDGTKLDGIWLFNGVFDDKGNFKATERDDVYRYTRLTDNIKNAINMQTGYTEYSSDAWGEFVTGYVPLYTDEGSFVGLLGIDMEPNKYQEDVLHVIIIMFLIFAGIAIALVLIFLYFYFRYVNSSKHQLAFEFYSQMSHDMRTPMNGILGLTDLSKEENNPQVLKENMAKIHEAGHYMLSLINDTLDYEKMANERFKLELNSVNMEQLFSNICDMIMLSAREKGVEFVVVKKNVNLSEYVMVDALRIKQLFINLLSNAVKFTPAGGRVEMLIEETGRSGKLIHNRIVVKDNGIGMSKEFLENRIYRPFSQEHNEITDKTSSTGLGLSIVKKLIELMGAKISVDSRLGEGTTFTVLIDFETAGSALSEAVIEPKIEKEKSLERLAGKTILIVEDNQLNAEIAKRLLEKVGCIVLLASNGSDAVDVFFASKIGEISAILMDIRMPVMNGLQAARAIRVLNRADAAVVPIIAMTANAYEEDMRKSRDAGMNLHLAKPIEPNVLYRELAGVIE